MIFLKNILPGTVLLFLSTALYAQTDSAFIPSLDSIAIRSYLGKSLLETPAAINYISSQQLERFSNSNMLQALNATPGVRMEERSPGSYRLNIRGSSVRSPFGVRNVKIYYAGIPFTAPGGSSMLNMLGYYNTGSLEIIKGPAGSMYGAGTGGVLLVQPPSVKQQQQITAGVTGGSFGMFGANAAVSFAGNSIRYEHLQSDGYRDHTAMRRDNLAWDGNLQSSSNNKLDVHLLYSNLFYETPGALTLNEFNTDPKAARPASPVFPGAEQARASIHQQSILFGLINSIKFSETFHNSTAVYGLYGYTKNPTVQNYERKREPHFGGRTVFNYTARSGKSVFDINAGLEFQNGNFGYKTYSNDGGKPDSLMTEDELDIQQYFGFAQVSWSYGKWILGTGGSVASIHFDFKRLTAQPVIGEEKKYSGSFTPRFAILYKITNSISAYMNIAKGFSPPAADEIFADNNSYNLALQPEKSWNYEPGIRGTLLKNKLAIDLSYFVTGLQNSIVTRRDAGGGNYYVNAGKTTQQGFEGSLGYELFSGQTCFLYGSRLRATYSHYRFRYKTFVQSGNDYSGNKMPGVSPSNLNLLADIQTKQHIYLNLSYSYTDQIELNDANSASAEAYHLLSARLGYKKYINKLLVSVFTGADNIGNVTYSLGNDINGFGGRYYNVAPARFFYMGASINF